MAAPKNNQNAAKPASQRTTGLGRTVLDLGPLKAKAVRAASRRKQKLVAWVREAIADKLERDA